MRISYDLQIFCRRVPIDFRPPAACVHDERIVHGQSHDGGAADGGATEDLRGRTVPDKMVSPSVTSRMEQGPPLGSYGINGFRLAALELVASPARETKVLEGRVAPLSSRDNVIDGHRLPGIGLGCVAVSASAIISVMQPFAQRGKQIDTHARSATRP